MNAPEAGGDEYNLAQDDQKRQMTAELEAEIIKALESGPGTPVTKEFWQTLRQEVRKRAAQGS